MTWLLYGANGYTGELIAEEAARRGDAPILAGRREQAIRPLAERLGLPWRVFDLGAPDELARGLEGVKGVLLCAGPFSATSQAVVEACLAAGAHYLDITGEIAVFERVLRRDEEAKRRGVVLLPGVGFDVVPSDCLAASLHRRMPAATRLELAFASAGRFSRGTAKTMLEGVPQGGAIRRDGKITRVPLAWKTIDAPFRDRSRKAVSIPWGDVSTAYRSTGIPEIVTYMALPPRLIRAARLARPFARLLGLGPVQAFLRKRIERTAPGPSVAARQGEHAQFWGRVTDASGRTVEGTLATPEPYTLTVLTALACMGRLLEGGSTIPAGAHTPSTAFGADFINEFEGCEVRIGGT